MTRKVLKIDARDLLFPHEKEALDEMRERIRKKLWFNMIEKKIEGGK